MAHNVAGMWRVCEPKWRRLMSLVVVIGQIDEQSSSNLIISVSLAKFQNFFCLGLLWILAKRGRQNCKDPILLWFDFVKNYNVLIITGSYSSSQSQEAVSPYSTISIASSPQSNGSFPDLYNTSHGR